jgi:hypothetical protein
MNAPSFLSRMALIVALPFLLFCGCSEDPANDIGNGLDPANVLESTKTSIGAEGGTISLSDGCTVDIAAGALSAATEIQIARLRQDDFFTGAGLLVYDVSAANAPSAITVTLPAAKGQSSEDFAIFNYDPTYEGEIDGRDVPFTYDPVSGSILAVIRVDGVRGGEGPRKALAGIKRTRIVVANEPLVEPGVSSKTIAMPFYQQDAKTCYATCVKMLARAYSPQGTTQVCDLLKWIDYPPTTGPNSYMYQWHMPSLIRRSTGLTAQSGRYWWARSAFNNLITQLDAGYPVVIGRMGHSIIVIGYEKTSPLKGPASYRYLVNDPSGDYAPNTWKNWDWLFQRSFDFNTFVEIWIPQAPPADRTLQTLGMPMTSATGRVEFLQPNEDSGEDVPMVSLDFNKASSTGYGWKYRTQWVSRIPEEASKIRVQAQLRNADATKAPRLGVSMKIAQHGTGGGVFVSMDFLTPPSSGAKIEYMKTVELSKFFQAGGDTTCTMTMELFDAQGKTIDKWSVDFILSPAAAEYRIIKESGNASPSGITLTLPTQVEFGKSYHIRGVWADVPTYPDAQYSILGGFVSDETDLEKELWVQAVFRDKFVDLKGFHHYFDDTISIPDTDKTRKYFKLQITMRAYDAANASAPYWLQTRIYKIPIKR